MRFEPTFLVVLCFFLCLCNGAPGGKVNKSGAGAVYTNEEDTFIMEELLNLLDKYKTINSKFMWAKIQATHSEKCKQGVNGFPHERAVSSLRTHFSGMLCSNHSHDSKKLPERLLKKIAEVRQMKADKAYSQLRQRSYSAEEDQFILEELRKSSYANVFGASTLQAIHAELKKKHQDKVPGFENERTLFSLRSKMIRMRTRGIIPDGMSKTFSALETEGSSSDSPSQSQPTDFQCAGTGPDEDWIAEMVDELKNNVDVEFDFEKLNAL